MDLASRAAIEGERSDGCVEDQGNVIAVGEPNAGMERLRVGFGRSLAKAEMEVAWTDVTLQVYIVADDRAIGAKTTTIV